jgi:carotenoid cleavage dioxygenase
MPYGWDEAYGARIGLMPLDRPGEVTWFDVDPAYVFHVGNAATDAAGRVVLDAARYAPADAVAMWDGLGPTRPGPPARPPPAASPGCTAGCSTRRPGTVTETPLSRPAVEFPDRRRRARRPRRPIPLRRRHAPPS